MVKKYRNELKNKVVVFKMKLLGWRWEGKHNNTLIFSKDVPEDVLKKIKEDAEYERRCKNGT